MHGCAGADAIERVRMFLAAHLRLRRRPNYGDSLIISAGRSDTEKVTVYVFPSNENIFMTKRLSKLPL